MDFDDNFEIQAFEILRESKGIIVGPPAAGKSTLVELISTEVPEVEYISLGNICRTTAPNSSLGIKMQELHEQGGTWPDEFLLEIILPHITKAKDKAFILDGIPRKLSELSLLQKITDEIGVKPTYVINLSIPDDVSVDRLTHRNQTAGSTRQESFNDYMLRIENHNKLMPLVNHFCNDIWHIPLINLKSVENSPKELMLQLLQQLYEHKR